MTVIMAGCILWAFLASRRYRRGETWFQAVWLPLEWALRMVWWLVGLVFRLIGAVVAGFAIASWFNS